MPTTRSHNGGSLAPAPAPAPAGESALAEGIRDLATRLDRLIRDFKAGAVPVAGVVARLYELEQEIAGLREGR